MDYKIYEKLNSNEKFIVDYLEYKVKEITKELKGLRLPDSEELSIFFRKSDERHILKVKLIASHESGADTVDILDIHGLPVLYSGNIVEPEPKYKDVLKFRKLDSLDLKWDLEYLWGEFTTQLKDLVTQPFDTMRNCISEEFNMPADEQPDLYSSLVYMDKVEIDE